MNNSDNPKTCPTCAGSTTGVEPPGTKKGKLTFAGGEEYSGPDGFGRRCPACKKLYLIEANRLD